MDTTKLTTTWDLEKFFYSSITDPRLEKDFKKTERLYKAFEKKYKKNKKHLKSPRALRNALDEYQTLSEQADSKPLLYLYYRKELNSNDNETKSLLAKYHERAQKLANLTLFFMLEISKIDTVLQSTMLKAKELETYSYFLTKIFEEGKHSLSEAEEKISNLKNRTSHDMWVEGHDKLLSNLEVTFDGKQEPVEAFVSKVSTITDTVKRRKANDALGLKLKELAPISELELNAVITNKRIDDELRGYNTPYEATVINYETDMRSVDTLARIVTENFSTTIHLFYETKRRLLKLDKLYYTDRGVNIFNVKGDSYQKSIELVYKSFCAADKECGDIVKKLATGGHIDVFPRQGKTGGAYCSHTQNGPTLVLLNHVNSARNDETIAHELGHAIHAELSKSQPPIYNEYSMITAEFASTFFEGIFFDQYVKTLDDKSAFAARHTRISASISTIQRQIAFFNFEKELHQIHKGKGYLTHEEIAHLFEQHLKAYLGKNIIFQENDKYSYVYIGHFRRFFYVFAYSYANLISLTMLERYRKDPKGTMKVVKEILKAGGSASPKDLFKRVGIDISSPSFLEEGLAVQKKEIDMFVKDSKKWIK